MPCHQVAALRLSHVLPVEVSLLTVFGLACCVLVGGQSLRRIVGYRRKFGEAWVSIAGVGRGQRPEDSGLWWVA
jgi:tetrahydromethanopterin S-methyltransferase subunit C